MDKRLLVAIGAVVVLGLVWSLTTLQQRTPPPPAPAAPPAPSAGVPVAPRVEQKRAWKIRHELYEATFVDVGATLWDFRLKKYKTPDRKEALDIVGAPIADPASRPFAVELVGDAEGQAMLNGPHDCLLYLRRETPDPQSGLADRLECKWVGKRLELVKRIHFRPQSYLLDVEVAVRNVGEAHLSATVALQMTGFQGRVEGGGCFQPPPDVSTPACLVGTSLEETGIEDLVQKHGGRRPFDGAVHWAGVNRRYFIAAAMPRDSSDGTTTVAFRNLRCELVARSGGAVGARVIPKRTLNIPKGRIVTARFSAYLGPKEHKRLESLTVDRAGAAASVGLEKSVDFWVLGFLCKPMLWLLNLFYGLVGNYGWAIIFLTIVVKIITFWPSQRAYRSMEAMKKLKGPMEEIKAKYGNDKNRMNQEMLNLYKQHKINPLGGCLPLLIQMPIWIALYRTIYASVELYQQPFAGWIEDLSAKDPYFVLPILLGVVMFVQQRMTPSTADSAQMKMMLYGMPLLFTAMMLFFPSGLVLYIFVNTVLSIGQQWLIKRGMERAR